MKKLFLFLGLLIISSTQLSSGVLEEFGEKLKQHAQDFAKKTTEESKTVSDATKALAEGLKSLAASGGKLEDHRELLKKISRFTGTQERKIAMGIIMTYYSLKAICNTVSLMRESECEELERRLIQQKSPNLTVYPIPLQTRIWKRKVRILCAFLFPMVKGPALSYLVYQSMLFAHVFSEKVVPCQSKAPCS